MKIKASLLITAIGVLKTIDLTAMKLSTSYKVRQVLKTCQEAVEDFEARRIALAEKFGTLNEEENRYVFATEEMQNEFQEKMQEMMDDEIEVEIKPIPYELLDEYITIEPANIDYVSWFISGLDE